MMIEPDGIHHLMSLMTAREGDVAAWMPVLGSDDMTERTGAQQPIDTRHDCIALMTGQGAARHEIRLYIDEDQYGTIVDDWWHTVTTYGESEVSA